MVIEGLFFGRKRNDNQSERQGRSSITTSQRTPPRTASAESIVSKTQVIVKTPGKKLLKRLFCTPTKSKLSVHSETSLEGPLDSNSTNGSIEEERQSTGAPEGFSKFKTTIQRPPSIIRHLPDLCREGEGGASAQLHNDMTAQNPATVPLPESPARIGDKNQQPISSILSSTSQSPENTEGDLYLAQASSSFSDENFSSPTSPPDHGASHGMAMRTPGLAIPTPQTKSLANKDNAARSLVFPHPLMTVSESPQLELTRHFNLSQSVSGSNEGEKEQDDDAFLPDDFRRNKRLYTYDEVQYEVKEAEQEVRIHLDDRHQHAIEEFQENMEKQLQEHGAQWKKDSEAEYSRLNQLVRDEKIKTQQKHLELLEKISSLSELESKLSEKAQETEDLQVRVREMENQIDQDCSVTEHDKELYLNQLHQQIQELQEELNHFKSASSGHPQDLTNIEVAKAAAEQRVEELEQLVLTTQKTVRSMELNHSMSNDDNNYEAMKKSYENEITSLKATNAASSRQIMTLQSQLDDLRQQEDSSNIEELMLVKSERAAYERKISDLEGQLNSRKSLTEEQYASQTAQLQVALAQVDSLRQQVSEASSNKANTSFSSEVSREDLFVAKAELETLRVLRNEDLKEKSDLQGKLARMEKELSISQTKKCRENTLAIDALTVEVLQSPNTSMCIDEKDILVLRGELEDMRAQRDSLEERVRELEMERDSKVVEEQGEQLRNELETQIRILKDELDRRARDFENEKRNLKADLSVVEIEELTSEVEELKRTHSDELETLRKELELSHEAAISSAAEMEKLRCESEEEIVLMVGAHAKEKKLLQTEMHQMKLDHAKELDFIRDESKEESCNQISALQKKLDRLRIEFEDEKIEIIRTSSKQADELKSKLSLQQQEHNSGLEMMQDQIQGLEKEIIGLQSTASEREAKNEHQIREIETNHQKELEVQRARSQDEIEALQDQLDSSLTEKTRLESKVSSLETQIIEMTENHKANIESTKENLKEQTEKELHSLEQTVKTLEANIQSDDSKAEYTRRIREVREEHNKEIDDLLKQLDLVEAEHNDKYTEKERLVREKEAVISALGSQLAESQAQLEATSTMTNKLNKQVKEQQVELEAAQAQTEAKSEEIKRMIASHEAVLQEEELLRDKLCEEAREEMIQRAEVQFQQANTTYKKLKQEFDVAMNKISILERELESSKKENIKIKKEMEIREVDLADELAQAKAAIATTDLNATRKVKQYRLDLERLKEVETDLRRQLDEASATSRSMQTTLASVVSEKEKLIEENIEMKAVCEELMEIVEGKEQ